MVNSYDVAVLSEKVAYLEAALKSAGIELPEVSASDNGKVLQVVNGAWATGQKIIDPGAKVVSYEYSQEASTGTYANIEIPLSETGYTPVGLVGFALNSVSLILVKASIEEGSLIVTVAPKSGTDVAAGTRNFDVLFIKSDNIIS